MPDGVTVGDEKHCEVQLTIGSFVNNYAMSLTASDAMLGLGCEPGCEYAAALAAGVDAERVYHGLYY